LKSETSGLSIPQIALELQPGTLGGRFTTIEGLLRQVYRELDERAHFRHGDGVSEERKTAFTAFLQKLDDVIEFRLGDVVLELDDPMANSYIQNLYAPDADPEMSVREYERTYEQNEEWGLNDIKTEGY
jgi:zinc finger protein